MNTDMKRKNLKLFFQVSSNIGMMLGSINTVNAIANTPPMNEPTAVLVIAKCAMRFLYSLPPSNTDGRLVASPGIPRYMATTLPTYCVAVIRHT